MTAAIHVEKLDRPALDEVGRSRLRKAGVVSKPLVIAHVSPETVVVVLVFPCPYPYSYTGGLGIKPPAPFTDGVKPLEIAPGGKTASVAFQLPPTVFQKIGRDEGVRELDFQVQAA